MQAYSHLVLVTGLCCFRACIFLGTLSIHLIAKSLSGSQVAYLGRCSLVLLWLQFEVHVCGDRDVERAQFVGFISRGHNNVPVGVAIQNELL